MMGVGFVVNVGLGRGIRRAMLWKERRVNSTLEGMPKSSDVSLVDELEFPEVKVDGGVGEKDTRNL